MSVTFDSLPVYSMLGDGRLVQTNTYQDDGSDKFYVGGKIFYIDETSSGGTYTFYSRTGKVLTDIRVGDAPYAYKITGTPTKDKFYVFNANTVYSKTWTYKDASEQWVLNLLNTAGGIGKGKPNTVIVKTADSGAYESYANTIWNSLKSLNDNADKGCTDWFVPSEAELEALRTATDRDGNALTTYFANNRIWTSYNYSASGVRYWNGVGQSWGHAGKTDSHVLLTVRGF